jgi:hypothetical protein
VQSMKKWVCMEHQHQHQHAAFACFTCGKDVPLISAMTHIPRCYREWCMTVLQTEPLCTCSSCQGLGMHVECAQGEGRPHKLAPARRSPQGARSSMSSSPARSPMPSSLLLDRDKPSAASHLAYNAPSAPLISVRGLQGKECAVCSAKKSGRSITLPRVHIGQFQ